MEVRQLKIFCEVYRGRNYSVAAKRVKLTQSAVSQQIKALELALGVKLFETADRSQPTAAGDYLFREGARFLADIADIENGVRYVSGVGSGTVRFGMIDVAAIWLLPGVLGAFKKSYPHVKVEAVVKTSGDLIEEVERHALDFAIVVTNKVPESLDVKNIYSDSIVAVVPKKSRLNKKHLSVKDLKGEPLILYPMTSYSRTLIEDIFRKHGVVPTVNMEMHYPAAILSLVEQGMGVGLVSELSAKEMRLKKQVIARISEFKGVRKIGIVTAKARRQSPQTQALIGQIIQHHIKTGFRREA